MKKTLFIFGLFLFVSVLSCNSDDDNPILPEPPLPAVPDYTYLDQVTGIDLFDANGNPLGRWKSPNDKPGPAETFPNPNTGVVSLYSPQKITRIWLLPADCLIDSLTTDIPTLSQDLRYELSQLDTVQIRDISFTDPSNQVTLDFSDVTAGFYKLFYQLENTDRYWRNIYMDSNASSIPTFEDLDAACN